MIEAIVIKYLSNKLQDVPVFAEVPVKAPKKFVVIEKIDGGQRNQIKASSISIQCYDDTLAKASALIDLVDDTIYGIVENDLISRVELGGSSRNTDIETKSYRYENIYNFFHY